MKEPTVEQLATLARAMGHTVKLDDSGGYGVVQVLVSETIDSAHSQVFRPHESTAQAFEVLAWLMRRNCIAIHGMPHCIAKGTVCVEGPVDDDSEITEHDGTAAGIRRAVVDAAISVAESMQAEDDGA